MSTVFLYIERPAPDNSFGQTARTLAEDLGVSHCYPFQTGAEIFSIFTGDRIAFNSVSRLIIFAHGSPNEIGWSIGSNLNTGGGISNYLAAKRRGNGWIHLEDFCELVAPKLQNDCVIGLAACSCGRGPRDPITDVRKVSNREALAARYNATGRDSFAYQMRDLIVRQGKQVEVRAHIVRGSQTENPHGIYFNGNAGDPGILLVRSVYSRIPTGRGGGSIHNVANAWDRYFQGNKAQEWLLGGALPGDEEIRPEYRNRGEAASIIPVPSNPSQPGSQIAENTDNTVVSGGGGGGGGVASPNNPTNQSSSSPSVVPTVIGNFVQIQSSLRAWAYQKIEHLNNLIELNVN